MRRPDRACDDGSVCALEMTLRKDRCINPSEHTQTARPGRGVGGVACRLAFAASNTERKPVHMNIHLGLAPLVSLLAGILILVMPRLLNYIVAIYLIVIGLIGIFGAGNMNFS